MSGEDEARQLWRFILESDGTYQIRAQNQTEFVISSETIPVSNGKNVVQLSPNEDDTNNWQLIHWSSMHTDVFIDWGVETPQFTLLLADANANSSIWKPIIESSVSAWNDSAAGVNINIITTGISDFEVYVAPIAENCFGATYAVEMDNNGNLEDAFIVLNTNMTTTNIAQSVMVHEIGHLLWLADNPAQTVRTIMSYERDRTVMILPQKFDIYNVYYRYY